MATAKKKRGKRTRKQRCTTAGRSLTTCKLVPSKSRSSCKGSARTLAKCKKPKRRRTHKAAAAKRTAHKRTSPKRAAHKRAASSGVTHHVVARVAKLEKGLKHETSERKKADHAIVREVVGQGLVIREMIGVQRHALGGGSAPHQMGAGHAPRQLGPGTFHLTSPKPRGKRGKKGKKG